MSPVTKPPISPYGTLSGQIFCYAANRVAFESTTAFHSEIGELKQLCPNKCILLGGLSDGLLPTPYTQRLEQACAQANWSLVQPLMSSSYTGFGHGRLERDTRELDELLDYLMAHRDAQKVAFVGHSTGCQNIIHYLKHGRHSSASSSSFSQTDTLSIPLAVLQAPVSDREHAAADDADYETNIETARTLQKAGKGEEMMPRGAFWAPITARRFLDLQEPMGADDFFSSDLSDKVLVERLGHVGSATSKCIVAFSGADEYVPASVDSRNLTDRLVRAMNANQPGVAEALFLETGNHNLSEGANDANVLVERIGQLLQQQSLN